MRLFQFDTEFAQNMQFFDRLSIYQKSEHFHSFNKIKKKYMTKLMIEHVDLKKIIKYKETVVPRCYEKLLEPFGKFIGRYLRLSAIL